MKTMNVVLLLVGALSLASAAGLSFWPNHGYGNGGCYLGGFPEKVTYYTYSWMGSYTCPPTGSVEPTIQGPFILNLVNSTECRYTGDWPENNGFFVGFWNGYTKTLEGGWSLPDLNMFGSAIFSWDGVNMEGPYSIYPNIRGCDRHVPFVNTTDSSD